MRPDLVDVRAEASASSASPLSRPCSRATLSSAAGSAGKQVRLRIVDHLHAVLDRAQQAVGVGELARHRHRRDRPAASKRLDRVERRRRAHRRVAAAVDHLLDLDEELDLANAAAPALRDRSRGRSAHPCAKWSRIRAEICRTSSITPKSSERRQTNGWIASRKRCPSARSPAAARARMNAARSHGSALDFVVRDRGIDRQGDRRDFGRRPEPQVDALDIAVFGPLLQDLDDAAGRFAPPLRPASSRGRRRQGRRIEQQQQIDVRRIIELVTAELAHGDDREALGVGIRHALGDRRRDGLVDRLVGEIGQQAGDVARAAVRRTRSPSATASARPWRCRRSRRSTVRSVRCDGERGRGCGIGAPLARKTSAMSRPGDRCLAQERRVLAALARVHRSSDLLRQCDSSAAFHMRKSRSGTKLPALAVVCKAYEAGARRRCRVGSAQHGPSDHPGRHAVRRMPGLPPRSAAPSRRRRRSRAIAISRSCCAN